MTLYQKPTSHPSLPPFSGWARPTKLAVGNIRALLEIQAVCTATGNFTLKFQTGPVILLVANYPATMMGFPGPRRAQ